ncbi:MAG: hypothetical protein Q7S31_00015 [bacterium]|nr:hypothetical protein [bacterium]
MSPESRSRRFRSSSLADEISLRVAQEERKRVLEQAQAAEKARLVALEMERKAKETKERVQQTFDRLKIRPTLEDLRDNVWKGGEITQDHSDHKLVSRLRFKFASAHPFYSIGQGDFGPDEFRGYTINIDEINLILGVKGNPQDGSCYLVVNHEELPIKDEDETAEYFRKAIVDASLKTAADGYLPVSQAIKTGKENIHAARESGDRVYDDRPSLLEDIRKVLGGVLK